MSQLKKLKCSIALLQETHLTEAEGKKLNKDWVNQVFHASYGKKRGVAILINKSLPFSAEKVIKDNMGRYVMVVGSISDLTVSILNVYFPNEDKDTFLKEIANLIMSNGKGMVIMGGDFNVVQNGKLDRLPPEMGSKKSNLLNNVIKELGLIDPWRHNNPRGRDFTFYSNPHDSYSRIDFFLCVSAICA